LPTVSIGVPLLYNRVPRPRRNAWKPCHSTPVPCNVFLIIFDPRVAKSRGKTRGPSKTHVVPGFCFRCFFSSAITFGKRCTLAARCSVFVSMTSLCHTVRTTINCLITSKSSIHRVSRSLPRSDTALQHLDVGKTLLSIFRCLTDSAGFAGSASIENDFLCLRQRRRPGLQAGEGYGPVQI